MCVCCITDIARSIISFLKMILWVLNNAQQYGNGTAHTPCAVYIYSPYLIHSLSSAKHTTLQFTSQTAYFYYHSPRSNSFAPSTIFPLHATHTKGNKVEIRLFHSLLHEMFYSICVIIISGADIAGNFFSISLFSSSGGELLIKLTKRRDYTFS